MNDIVNPALAHLLSEAHSATPKKRIFIVEDEAILALDLAERLQELGYEVCGSADNGPQAIYEIDQLSPDLVMMDMQIKGDMDGIETASQVLRSRHIAVVFLTAFSDKKTIERAALVAPYGYLTKPLQPRGLQPAIEVALRMCAVERRLRESEHWYAATLRGVNDGVVATDGDGLVRFMNPAAERLTRWTLAEARGLSAWEVLELHDASTGQRSRQEGLLRDGHMRSGDVLLSRDGRRRNVDHAQSAIRDESGELLGAVTLLRDVSDRQEREATLRQSEERFRITFDTSPIGLAMVARDGRFLRLNTAMANLVHLTPNELQQTREQDITHPDDRRMSDTQIAVLQPGMQTPVQFGKRYLTPRGEVINTMVSVSLVPHDLTTLCYLYQVRLL